MPTMLLFNSIESITLPQPYRGTVPGGTATYLPDDPDAVRSFFAGPNKKKVPKELQLTYVSASQVPTNGYEYAPLGNNVKQIDATLSPYTVAPEDTMLLVDTTAGAVTIKLPATPIIGQTLLDVVDAKRQFATNACTLDAGSGTINGGGATLALNVKGQSSRVIWTGNTYNVQSGSGATGGGVKKIQAVGLGAAGAITATGVKVGDIVESVEGFVTATGAWVGLDTTHFEATITVADQIQQTSGALSANTYIFTIRTQS